MDLTSGQVYLYLYTKFGPKNVNFSAAWKTIVPADIFFDTNLLDDDSGRLRNYDMAIHLQGSTENSGLGYLYTGLQDSNITTSENIMTNSNTGWALGGRFYDTDTPIPVEVTGKEPINKLRFSGHT